MKDIPAEKDNVEHVPINFNEMKTTNKSSTKKSKTQQKTTNNISTSKRVFATKSISSYL